MWAHSANDQGVRHGLADHLRSTATLARQFAVPFGAGDLAWALGLFHDAGKAWCDWQAKLLRVEASRDKVGLDHKELGARLLAEAADVGAMAVLGHHGGLQDVTTLAEVLERDAKPHEAVTTARFLEMVPEAKQVLDGPLLVPGHWLEQDRELLLEMGLRLVYSALVDADHLDTGAHRRGLAAPQVASVVDMPVLVERFERRRQEFLACRAPSPMDDVRAGLYDAAVRSALDEPGVYRMAAPTGTGKTIP